MTYGTVTAGVVAELRAIVGEKSVWIDEERLEAYAHDETSTEEYAHAPEAIVLPTTTEHVAAIVRLANRDRIPITPRGAGSGLSGGAIPIFGGILISLERMDKLIDLDLHNMTITVEAGMVTNDLAHLVAEHGLFFAGYPMSVETCQIGGNIAENAGGGKAVKYGVTGRYVLGLELVTPTGDVVWLGGKLAKDVSGYDLKQLVIGSEGTLGIVTQAIIKLTAYPKAASDLLVLFESPRAAIDLVPRMLRQGIVPTGIEFMDRLSFQTSCEYLNETLPYEDAGAMLLIEVDGNDPAAVEADLLAIGDLCEKHGAIEVYVAEDRNAVERVWSVRRNIAEAFKVEQPGAEPGGHRRPGGAHPRRHPRARAAGRRLRHADPLLRPRRRRQPARHAGQGPGHGRRDLAHEQGRLPARALPLRPAARRQDQRRARHRPQAQEVPPRRHQPRRTRTHARHQARLGPQPS
jgi:glycolate oxidase